MDRSISKMKNPNNRVEPLPVVFNEMTHTYILDGNSMTEIEEIIVAKLNQIIYAINTGNVQT